MGTVSLTLPSDGQTIDASDVNNPLNTLAAEINGQLDNSNIKTGAAIDRSKIAGFTDGWESLGYAPTTITALGNRSYTVVIPSVDTTTATSPGQRLKLPRTVTAPTYMGGAFNGSSHYFTKVTPTGTLSTVTNNWTIMAHHEPTAYGAVNWLGGRMDSSGNNGFGIKIGADGTVTGVVVNTAAANFRQVSTNQSLPLNKKTHIAVTWTSGTCVIYFDGKSVPVGAAVTGGTAPTVAGTGGDFSIGRPGAQNTQYMPGYIAGFGVFDAVLSGATILQHMNQALTGSETNCIGAWNLNNAATDATASANNLTATGGVGYTARSPYTNPVTGTSVTAGTTNYGIIMAQTFSTNTTYTIQIPEGETLPTTGGIGTVSYSTQKTPYGFPVYNEKLVAEVLLVANSTVTSTGAATDIPGLTHTFTVPTTRAYKITAYFSNISMATGAPPAITLNLTDGSNNILTGLQLQSGGANYQNTTTLNSESMVLAAGSTTLKMRGTAASTFSLNSAAGNKTYLRIEEA